MSSGSMAIIGMNAANWMLEQVGVENRLAIGVEMEVHGAMIGILGDAVGGKGSTVGMYYGSFGNSDGEYAAAYDGVTGNVMSADADYADPGAPIMVGGMASVGVNGLVAFGKGGSQGMSGYSNEFDLSAGPVSFALGSSVVPTDPSVFAFMNRGQSGYGVFEVGIPFLSEGVGTSVGGHMVQPVVRGYTNGEWRGPMEDGSGYFDVRSSIPYADRLK